MTLKTTIVNLGVSQPRDMRQMLRLLKSSLKYELQTMYKGLNYLIMYSHHILRWSQNRSLNK